MTTSLIGYRGTGNIGDAVQTYALSRLLPDVSDRLVDRDDLGSQLSDREGRVVVNGWLTQRPEAFLAPSDTDVRFLSVHLSPSRGMFSTVGSMTEALRDSEPLRESLQRAAPIGARDLFTLGVLDQLGIEAEFTGCVTLQLERRPYASDGPVLAIDVPESHVAHLRGITRRSVVTMTNASQDAWMTLEAVERAVAPYLDLISTASIVVTPRLHAALPAVALGVPLLFCPADPTDVRFSGLLDFIPTTLPLANLCDISGSLLEPPFPAPVRKPIELQPAVQRVVMGERQTARPSAGGLREHVLDLRLGTALRDVEGLRSRVADLEGELAAARRDLEKLRSRRSVRAALGLARLVGRPLRRVG